MRKSWFMVCGSGFIRCLLCAVLAISFLPLAACGHKGRLKTPSQVQVEEEKKARKAAKKEQEKKEAEDKAKKETPAQEPGE